MLGSHPSLSYKATRGSRSGWKSGWDGWKMPAERKQGRSLLLHLPPTPAWGGRWAHLLGWQAGNIRPGHCLLLSHGNSCYELPVPSAFFYKTNTTRNTPFFSKRRVAVKKGFHWCGRRAYAHSSSDCSVGANSLMLTFLVLFFSFLPDLPNQLL